jgi:pimeloyl-ACP methyl ester carboxylesterase
LVRPTRVDWNPSLTPRTIQIERNTVFYVVKGEGDPLLLIHGYGAASWVWEKQMDVLSRNYKVYALDIIGYGYSDRPRIEYTPETYIHFLRDFMDALEIERATLIGNSMGGGIAWAMAALYPKRVEKLILIDCVPPDVLKQVRNESFRILAVVKDIPFLPYLVIASRHKNSIKRILQECLFDRRLISPALLDRQWELIRFKGSTWVLHSTLKHAKDTSRMGDYLSLINHPTLLIWGEQDLVFPPSVGQSLHRAIKGSTFHLVKKSGHIPMWETPEEVNRVILEFLKA